MPGRHAWPVINQGESVRPSSVVLAAAAAAATITVGTATALAAPASATAGRTSTALSNPGAASPSLSLAASATGVPEAAVIGKDNSLWYYTKVKGKWKRTEVAGSGTAFSAPSLVSEPGTDAAVAVEGPGHSLGLYVKINGHWHREKVAGANTTYSAPSLQFGVTGAGIAVEGKNHSLWFRWLAGSGRWRAKEILSRGWAYSAPSLVIRSTSQGSSSGGPGQADIAYEGPGNALLYVHSAADYRHWVNDSLGPKLAFSAPSLVVLDGADATQGEAFIAVEGLHHSLWTYTATTGLFTGQELLSSNWIYSAPAAVQNNLDTQHAIEVAYRGPSRSVGVLLFLGGTSWQNDELGHDGGVDSAPALVAQANNGQLDLIYQGPAQTLWYYHAPVPLTPVAPTFTGGKIGGAGSTYGG
jgi:hypothetical protein